MAPVIERWGRIPYLEAHARQLDLVARRAAGAIEDTLALCEHDPVITLGRGTDPRDVLDRRFPTVETERGGEATYHGPGQLLGYVIRRLPPAARDLHAHLRLLEGWIIDALAAFGVVGVRRPGATGVWIEGGAAPRKIASLGVAAKSWTTFHGFALNVDPDLTHFAAIRPCGFDASVMTSVAAELGRRVALEEAAAAVAAAAERSHVVTNANPGTPPTAPKPE
jgi:lipoyl(octanoyl) transferase